MLIANRASSHVREGNYLISVVYVRVASRCTKLYLVKKSPELGNFAVNRVGLGDQTGREEDEEYAALTVLWCGKNCIMNWTRLGLLPIRHKEPWNVFQLNEILEVRKEFEFL